MVNINLPGINLPIFTHGIWSLLLRSPVHTGKRGDHPPGTGGIVVRGTIVNRTYGTHKKPDVSLFLQPIFGPIYYGPR